MRPHLIAALALVSVSATVSLAAPPSLVPPGWQEVREGSHSARTFVSPDGSARVRFGHAAARNTRDDVNRFINKPDEQITYRRVDGSWFAVSGYRGGDIFYRKGNLACAGSRWNVIEFRYPREAKHQMDAAVAAVAHNMTAYQNDCG